MKELRERKIPFTIRRYLPDGRWDSQTKLWMESCLQSLPWNLSKKRTNFDVSIGVLVDLYRQLFFTKWWHIFYLILCGYSSFEDWGVDELIVEDSWKRQVGGDWSVIFLAAGEILFQKMLLWKLDNGEMYLFANSAPWAKQSKLVMDLIILHCCRDLTQPSSCVGAWNPLWKKYLNLSI